MADSSVNSEDRSYVYDTAWNLNYRTNNGVLATFKVDNKNQLTNAPVWGTESFDDNGNLTLFSSLSFEYSYDDENRLQNEYYYDSTYVGTGIPTSAADLRTEFVYDGLGRLRKRIEYGASTGTPYTWVV